MSMEIIKPGVNVDIVGKRKIGFALSLAMIFLSIATLIINNGPNYGIDFAGGTVVQVKFDGSTEVSKIKAGLKELGLEGAAVQRFGPETHNEYLIHTNESLTTDQNFSAEVRQALDQATGKKAEIRRVEMVGPQVGETLREKALFALFYALLFITIYISGRFEMKWVVSGVTAAALIAAVYFLSLFKIGIPFLILVAMIVSLVLFWQLHLRYAMGATIALIHDVIITIGFFTLVGHELSLPIVAALLTIIGYSLNDTIIVFDRIRENVRRYSRRPLALNINRSINETFSRTLLTSGTTLIVLLCLFFLGGDIIHDFAFTLIIGIVVGTYSSIFVASPILMLFGMSNADGEPNAVSTAG